MRRNGDRNQETRNQNHSRSNRKLWVYSRIQLVSDLILPSPNERTLPNDISRNSERSLDHSVDDSAVRADDANEMFEILCGIVDRMLILERDASSDRLSKLLIISLTLPVLLL